MALLGRLQRRPTELRLEWELVLPWAQELLSEELAWPLVPALAPESDRRDWSRWVRLLARELLLVQSSKLELLLDSART
jgi:hypothetical protein